MTINQAIRDWIDPRWVTETELVDYLSRVSGQSANPIPIVWSRRFKTFNVDTEAGRTFTVPMSHYWIVDLINATIGTGPGAVNFAARINFGKPNALTGAGDLTYYSAATNDYAGAVTQFVQIGGGAGDPNSYNHEFIDMAPVMLEPGDTATFGVYNPAANCSFYGVMWYWERAGV